MDEFRRQMEAAHAAQQQAQALAQTQGDLALARGSVAKLLVIVKALKTGAISPGQVVVDGDSVNVLEQVPGDVPAAVLERTAPEA